MQTLNDALYALYVNREVTLEEALRVSSDPNELLRVTGHAGPDDGTANTAAPLSAQNGKLAAARR
jgi:twitching motility protein PilT